MSVSESPARLAVRSVDDLVGLAPYLIGFQPAESLVVVILNAGSVEVTARVDLEAVAEPDDLANLVGRLFVRFPRAEAWFLAFTDRESLAWRVLASCAALIGVMRLGRVVQVGTHEWRADGPEGPSGPVGRSVAAVEAAVIGLPLRRSRAELQALVAGPPDAEAPELFDVFERIAAEVAELSPRSRRRMLQRLLCRGGERVRADWVRLAVLVARPEDAVTVLARMDRQNAEDHLGVWQQVVRHCLAPFAAAPLGLLGVASWLTGDGAMETVCLEQIDRIDPVSPMGALLDWINDQVLPPDGWADCRDTLVAVVQEWFRAAGAGASPFDGAPATWPAGSDDSPRPA